MSAPLLPLELVEQLARVPVSRDRNLEYSPCRVRLRSGEVLPCVYVVEESAFLAVWGDDPSRPFLDISQVASIEDSPARLPADLANILYMAGESGMGYFIFTVHLQDGRTVAFLTGGAVDFPDWPPGIDPAEAISVEPHVGRDQFQRSQSRNPPHYVWCLYSAGKSR
jgi:hypothetical protein